MTDVSSPQNIAEAMSLLGPMYLQLLREQYLDDDQAEHRLQGAFSALVVRMAGQGKEALILEFVDSANWREVLVGTYCIVALQKLVSDPEWQPSSGDSDAPSLSLKNRQKLNALLPALQEELSKRLLSNAEVSLRPVIGRPLCIALGALGDRKSLETVLNLRPIPADSVEVIAAAFAGIQSMTGYSDKKTNNAFPGLREALRQDSTFAPDIFKESKNRCLQALHYWATAPQLARSHPAQR